MPDEVREYGHLGLLARGDLIAILCTAAAGVDIRYETTIAAVDQAVDAVTVELSDGSVEHVDVLIGADGIGSDVRDTLPGHVQRFDTGWACLVWWADADLAVPGEVTERWGAGTFLGTYACPGQLCVIAGAPVERIKAMGQANAAVDILRAHGLTGPKWRPQLEDEVGLWPMTDARAPDWTAGRVALVGDAAAAFLPTAGIGASIALESAAALADELSRADATSAPKSLGLYERRRRQRTERAQTLSRRLARMTFIRSRPLALARNRLLSHTNVETLVSPLLRDLRRPI
jgi:2-polyprenyl-6-methoxyphenol hydroxylase-like FAD-dependent oxidoreductase